MNFKSVTSLWKHARQIAKRAYNDPQNTTVFIITGTASLSLARAAVSKAMQGQFGEAAVFATISVASLTVAELYRRRIKNVPELIPPG